MLILIIMLFYALTRLFARIIILISFFKMKILERRCLQTRATDAVGILGQRRCDLEICC